MSGYIRKLTVLATALVVALSFASTVSAQVFTGRVDVTIEDSTGGRLPGVSVDLTGPVNQTQVTDAQGQAHFLNLSVGTYTVKAALSGFNTYTNAKVDVAAGASTPLPIKMGVAGTQETVNVTAATPIIDTKKETTTTNVTLEELQSIPSARDPWVVMQTVPTIYVDRVNVGGSESGQQSNYIGKGSYGTDNTWSIDGVPITDMGATGSSPSYYDFDMFQEMAVTTGGADAANPTPGVQLNMILKKGSNAPHGDGNAYWEGQSLQSSNLPADLAARLGGVSGKGNRTDKYLDTGFDLGGPIVKDKLWAWGRIGRTDVRNLTLTGSPDETVLKNYAFKGDAQLNNNIRGNFTFFEGNKIKNGRSVGPTRLPETGWNQTGPTKMYKGEGNFVIGQSLFASARYAYISGGFQLAPAGGMNTSAYQDDNGVWHGSYLLYKTDAAPVLRGRRRQLLQGQTRSEVRLLLAQDAGGFAEPVARQPDRHVLRRLPEHAGPVDAGLHRQHRGQVHERVRDRHDLDEPPHGDRRRALRPPDVVADLVDDAGGGGLAAPSGQDGHGRSTTRTTSTPSRRASGSPMRSTMRARRSSGRATRSSRRSCRRTPPTSSRRRSTWYATYSAVDTNHNGVADPNELGALLATAGFDPSNPGALSTANKIGNITAPRTQEALVGVDREVMPNFGVSATFTYRYMNDFLWNVPIGATRANYTQTGTFTGTFANVGTVSVPYYGLSAATAAAGNYGYIAENRPDYHQRYMSFELSATKRMSNRWMARFGFASSSWNEYFDAADAIMDSDADGLGFRSVLEIHRGRSQHQRRGRGHLVVGQRQERPLPGGSEVPDHRKRPLPGSVGDRLRRQHDGAPGLRRAVVPQPRQHG